MRFGVFDHLDRDGQPLADYYEARLKIVEACDRFWIPCLPHSRAHAMPHHRVSTHPRPPTSSQVAFGDLALAETLTSIALFAREVMPALCQPAK